MRQRFGVSVGLGLRSGLGSGLIIGLVAGLGGCIFSGTLPDLATFANSVFWLLLLALPVVYARNGAIVIALAESAEAIRRQIVLITAIAWLPAYLASVVAFMIPVVMVPFVLNKGVTFDNAARWYDQVYTLLLNGPVIWAGIATIIGFAAVAVLLRQRD